MAILNIKLPYDPVVPLLGIYPEKLKKKNIYIYMHLNVHCSTSYHSQNREVDKEEMIHIDNRILFNHKKNK